MYKKTFSLFVLFSLVSTVLFCQKTVRKEDEVLVKVDKKIEYTRNQFGGFSALKRSFPHPFPPEFPGKRSDMTFMLETDMIYETIPEKFVELVGKSDKMKWLLYYYPGQMYTMDVLINGMGSTMEEIENYYKKNPSRFLDTIQVNDSTTKTIDGKDTVIVTRRDSVTTLALGTVRDKIIKTLFLNKFPPEKEWLEERYGDSIPENQEEINNAWYYDRQNEINRQHQDFFLFKFYKELYGKELPEEVEDYALETGFITENDRDVILSWLPERRKQLHKTAETQKVLLRWLVRWKVYTEKAKKSGYMKREETRIIREWARKVETVVRYIDEVLAVNPREIITIDTTFTKFAHWDGNRKVDIPVDTAKYNANTELLEARLVGFAIDSIIHDIRKQHTVTFLQSDYTDQKDKDPTKLKEQADLARDSGNTAEAEKLYTTLITDFGYTPEGKVSLTELAKIQTENKQYQEAIRNYRFHTITGDTACNLCNTFFMIGFIYSEHIGLPELAEINYKWILKNEPDCELVDDAEFMMLHLDEPMISIEELQGQAARQGKNTGENEEDQN